MSNTSPLRRNLIMTKGTCGAYYYNVFPLLLAAAAVVFAWWMSLAPRPAPASAPPEMFSAERAHKHIAAVCIAPQPAGSVNNDHACQYIYNELQRLGVESMIETVYDKTSDRQVSRRRAVLGRIRGVNPSKAFAVDAHFDSVAWGPGAADDFSGIAAMLEAARAIKAGAPLQNDVIFVFSDQEEFNMGGAKLFAGHPWMNDVGVMLGLETRGSSGPSLMFETSPNNGFVVREMARSGVGARANSIMYSFYDNMPFNSDFDHYKNLTAGLNLAFIDNFDCYHTMLDNPTNVSLASLQHHGNYVLGLARHFGNMRLDDCYAPDATFFNTLGNHMVVYPLSWGWPLALAALLLWGGVMVFGFSRGSLGFRGVLSGFLSVLVASIIAAAPIGLVSYLVYQRFREAALYQNNVYALAFHLFGIGVLCLVIALLRRRAQPQELLGGGLAWWALGLLLMQWRLPGGANLTLWPLVAGAVYLLVLLLLDSRPAPSDRVLRWSVLLALPALMFIAPMIVLATYGPTVMASFIVVPITLILCVFVFPQLGQVSGKGLRLTGVGLIATGIILFGIAYRGTLPSPKSPLLNTLAYGVDFDAGEAWWLSGDRQLDEWTSLYIPQDVGRETLPQFLGSDQFEYYKAPAPMPPFGKAELDVLRDRIEEGRRVLDCRLNSPRDAQRLSMRVVSDTEIFGVSILGHDLPGAAKDWNARFEILPREGADLRIEAEANTPLQFSIHEVSFSLPPFPDFTPRPPHMMPEPNRRLDRRRSLHSEYTYSITTLDLGSGGDTTPSL